MMNDHLPRVALGVLCFSYLCTNCGSGSDGGNGNAAGMNSAGSSAGGSVATGGGATSPAAGRGGGHSGAGAGTAGMPPDGNAGEGGEAGPGGGEPTTPATGCDTRDTTDAKRVSSAITSNQTWSHLVYIDGAVTVGAGAHLTISPGTDVIVADGGSLVLGSDQSAVTLTAAGTETFPIRFCGEQKKVGAWGSLVIESGAKASSELRNVTISDAGSEDAALVLRSAVQVENVAIADSASDGVWASDFAEGSEKLSIGHAAKAAVVLTDSGAATRFPTGGSLKDNGDNTIHLRFAEMNTDTTFHDLDLPYIQEADVAAPEGKLTFDAGVDYRFKAGVGLLLGSALNKHVLVTAKGTAAAPVIFHGVTAGAGSWGSIQVVDNVDPASSFSQVEIHDGGKSFEVLTISSAVKLDHVLLDGNGAGVNIGDQGLDPKSTTLTVRNTAGLPVSLKMNAIITLPEGGTYTGNTLDGIGVTGGNFTLQGKVPNPGVPFYVSGDIRTLTGSSMTLSPGTQFIMSSNNHVDFGADDGDATVIAVGTANAHIRFSGYLEKSGFWAGITTGKKLSASSSFAFVDVKHGKAACLSLKMPAAVTNSSFSSCTDYGILKNLDDAGDYESTNTFADVGKGKVGTFLP